jgi:hypothetical protein
MASFRVKTVIFGQIVEQNSLFLIKMGIFFISGCIVKSGKRFPGGIKNNSQNGCHFMKYITKISY